MMLSLIYFYALLHHIICIVLSHIGFTFRGADIAVTDSQVRAITSYTIFLNRRFDNNGDETAWDSTPISSSSPISVTFPAEFTGL